MIHAVLAAVFCTIGIAALCFESIFGAARDRVLHHGFVGFYTLSTLSWLCVGIKLDDSSLVITSIVQCFLLVGGFCAIIERGRSKS